MRSGLVLLFRAELWMQGNALVFHQSYTHPGMAVVQLRDTTDLFPLLSVWLFTFEASLLLFPFKRHTEASKLRYASKSIFCPCHLRPTIGRPLSQPVSCQERVHAVCQDTAIAFKEWRIMCSRAVKWRERVSKSVLLDPFCECLTTCSLFSAT